MKEFDEKSLPSRGAWIETPSAYPKTAAWTSLPSRGAWIETEWGQEPAAGEKGRSLRGERGLKQWLEQSSHKR